MSALVALALAAVVTFTAGIKSYGIPKNEELVVYDVKESLDRAYDELTMDVFEAGFETNISETIKIYDENDDLVKSIELEEGDVIENNETKKLLNKAEFLTSYNKTSIYRIN